MPSLRARSGPREPTARRLFGCGSGPVSQPEIRAHRAGRRGRRGAAGRESGKVRAGNLPRLRAPRAGAALAAPLRKRIPPLCPALVQLTNDRCNPVRRLQPRRRCLQRVGRRRGGTCVDSPRRRQRTAESSEGVLYARGRPAVCKRGLLPAARGLSGEPEGVGRLRMNDAALCRALCRFRTAAVDRGHGGRAAAGGQHTRVCRRIRSPFLVLLAALTGFPRDIFIPQANNARSRRISPPAQGRLPPPSTQPSAPTSKSERVL